MSSDRDSLRKNAYGTDAVARLAREAQILDKLNHPNIVGVTARRLGHASGWLELLPTPSVALGSLELAPRELGTVIASAAATLTFVHDEDVAHGALSAYTIEVRDDRSAVLTGFDHAEFDLDHVRQIDDVTALGEVLGAGLRPGSDPLRRRINGVRGHDNDLTLRLLSIADEATSGTIDARQFATHLRSALEYREDNLRTAAQTRPAIPWKRIAAVVVPIALAIAAVLSVVGQNRQVDAEANDAREPVMPCPHLDTSAFLIDIDNDGCPNAIYVGDAAVTIDNQHYEVGVPDDRVVVGNWHGPGTATLALLRPTTGEVFVFDQWPAANAAATPRLLATIANARDISTLRIGSHDVIVVLQTLGSTNIEVTK